jgi:hypothetical protein
MILKIIPLDMAFHVVKYPFCDIEKWTILSQMKVDVSNIFKSFLYFMRFVKWEFVHEDEPLSIKARNDLGLNESYETSSFGKMTSRNCKVNFMKVPSYFMNLPTRATGVFYQFRKPPKSVHVSSKPT